jgi:hypothetical protein
MKYALDYLLGSKYPKVILGSHPKGWGAGFFSFIPETGSSLPVARQLAKTGRCPFIRFQLWWQDNHNFNGQEDKIYEQARKVRKLIKDFPEIRFEVSPACEHKWKRAKADQVCDEVAKILQGLPNVEVINSPWLGGGGELSNKYKNEVHRADNSVPTRGRFNFSYDGKAAVDMPVSKDKRRWRRAEWFFMWTHQLNLRRNEKDKTPRAERKARPTKELIESLVFLATKKGKTNIQKGWLAKSHAEEIVDKHGNVLHRSNKLMVLSDIKAASCELIDSMGRIVASAPYGGVINGNEHRYYFEKWGYQLAQKYGLLKVVINGKSYGTINAGFREGYFR